MMTTLHIAEIDQVRSGTAVRTMLHDIGYVLWLSRMVARSIESHEFAPARPEMFECCEFEMAECAC